MTDNALQCLVCADEVPPNKECTKATQGCGHHCSCTMDGHRCCYCKKTSSSLDFFDPPFKGAFR